MHPPRSSPLTVLIAEPDDLMRPGLVALLSRDARFAVVADTGADPRPPAQQLRPAIILLNPVRHGTLQVDQAVELIRKGPQSRVCIYTATFEAAAFCALCMTGAYGYLLK